MGKVVCRGKPWDPNLTWSEVNRSPRRALLWIYRRLTASWRGLPQIYIAGVKKGGTTSLFRYLIAHPRVWTPFRKEIKFFTYHTYLDEKWYRANFTWQKKLQEGGMTLDATPNYLMHPCFARRLHELTPNARIILLLRDPVQRVLSHYFHNRRLGIEHLPLGEALRSEKQRLKGIAHQLCQDPCYNPARYHRYGYLTESRYIEHLERLWKHFLPEQILVLRSEDLFYEPKQALERVAHFLDLEPWEVEFKVYNRGNYQVDSSLAPTIQWLRTYFRPYNERLYQLLGRDMEWEA